MIDNTTFPVFSPDNFSNPICSSANDEREKDPYINAATFSCSIIVAILSLVAVTGNGLVLAAVWKKIFQTTTFHILLSRLALTDLCTGLQPVCYSWFLTATSLRFIITVMSAERWLHMSRRSVVGSRRACFILTVLLLIPIPFVVFRSLATIKGNPAIELNITI